MRLPQVLGKEVGIHGVVSLLLFPLHTIFLHVIRARRPMYHYGDPEVTTLATRENLPEDDPKLLWTERKVKVHLDSQRSSGVSNHLECRDALKSDCTSRWRKASESKNNLSLKRIIYILSCFFKISIRFRHFLETFILTRDEFNRHSWNYNRWEFDQDFQYVPYGFLSFLLLRLVRSLNDKI